MKNSEKFLTKMYNLRLKNDNQNYLTKNGIANILYKETGIRLSIKEIKEIIDELISKGFIEKNSNGLRITPQGIQHCESKINSSKGPKVTTIVILGVIILTSLLYYVYL